MLLSIYKLHPDAELPVYATGRSSCFDIKAWLPSGTKIKGYNTLNWEQQLLVEENGELVVPSRWRVLIPTGLIFDMVEDQSVRLHPRSGLALRSGLMLANCEGVIDADYTEPVFVPLFNNSDTGIAIASGERIAQGELVEFEPTFFREVTKRPKPKTTRVGGFGSTGKE